MACASGSQGLDFFLLQNPQQFGLQPKGEVADLIEQDGAADGFFEKALLVLGGIGKGPLAVAEELAFQDGLGQGRAVDHHHLPGAALAEAVDGPGGHLFAGAALSQEQHRHVRAGQHLDRGENLAHFHPRTDHFVERTAARDGLLQANIFPQQTIALQGFAQQAHQFLLLEGLADKIVGSLLDGLHGLLDGAEGRHEDHRDERVPLLDFPCQGHAVHARHADVRQDHVHGLPVEDVESFRGAPGRHDTAIHFQRNGPSQTFQKILFVIHHQDTVPHAAPPGKSPSRPTAGKTMVKTLPRPGVLSTRISPSCSLTIP